MSKICKICLLQACISKTSLPSHTKIHLSCYLVVCILLSYKPVLEYLLLPVTWALVPLSVQTTQLQGAALPGHAV